MMLTKLNEELKSKREILQIEWEKKKEYFYRKIINLAEANQSLVLESEKLQGNKNHLPPNKIHILDLEEINKEITSLSELILSL